jgi:Transposase DDE domain group 1
MVITAATVSSRCTCSAASTCSRPSCGARTSTPGAGARDEVERSAGQIRARWPRVSIRLRADSGFARDELMAWCEANGVDDVFGLARNERLVGAIADELAAAVSARIARIVRCSTDFWGLQPCGSRANARNDAESSRWNASSW